MMTWCAARRSRGNQGKEELEQQSEQIGKTHQVPEQQTEDKFPSLSNMVYAVQVLLMVHAVHVLYMVHAVYVGLKKRYMAWNPTAASSFPSLAHLYRYYLGTPWVYLGVLISLTGTPEVNEGIHLDLDTWIVPGQICNHVLNPRLSGVVFLHGKNIKMKIK